MQGPRNRLDQIFPARKANSPALSATTKLDTSPSGKKREKPNEKSPHKKGTLEDFLVRSRSDEIHSSGHAFSGLGEKQNGFLGHAREPTLEKIGGSLGRNEGTNAADSWLQRCGPGAPTFVPKRLVDLELKDDDRHHENIPNAVDGPNRHRAYCDSLHDPPCKAVADVLQAANASGEEKVETDGSHVQLTQFANEFLSICVSGFATSKVLPTCEPVAITEASNKKRTIVADDDSGGSKKQRRDDDHEEDFILCTQFPMVTDITGNAVGRFGHLEEEIIPERTVGGEISCREHSNRNGVSSLPSGLAARQIAEGENPLIDKVNGPMSIKYEGGHMGKEKVELGASAPWMSRTSLECCNPAEVAGVANKGSVSGCTAEHGNLPHVPREGVTLPPVFKSPEEGRPRKGRVSGHRTPKSRSKSRSKGDEGELCSTPYSGSSKKSGRRSTSSIKSGGWQYHSSMFSPGDAFWDEAIEAVDGLLLSRDELPPKQTSIGRSKLSGAASDRTADVAGKRLDNQVEKVRDDEGMTKNVGETVLEEGSAGVSVVKTEGRIGTDSGNFVGRLREVDVSPLPVRRFSFTCQNSPLLKSVTKWTSDEVPLVCHLRVQCQPDPLLQKPHDSKDVVASDQAKTEADGVDVTEVEHKACHQMEVGEQSENGGMADPAPPVVAESDPTLFKPATAALCSLAEPPSNVMSHASAGLSAQGPSERLESSVFQTAADVAERGKEEVSIVTSSPKHFNVELSKWLPPEICAVFAKKGLTKLYPWQVECLQLGGVLEGRSLVYCASTSAGKSLVAEVLMLRRILSTGKKAVLVLPYVALCSEKADHLDALLEPLGKRVRGFYGAQGGASLPKDTSVAVCTIEKANSLINKLLEEGRLSELAIIVIDELHMVGDRDRGYLLELLLTKLRYAAGGGESGTADSTPKESMSSSPSWNTDLQIVGMSATMPNVSDVATWLQAALYQTEFRPVPLEEFMKVGLTIYNKTMDVVRSIRKGADLGGKDPDHVVELCHEVVNEGHSVLLFCSSRKGCETSARHIAKLLPPFLILEKKNATGPKDGNAAVEELRRTPAGLDPVLADTLPAGVAYHHAGLTVEERDVVEACFKSGVVRVLVATSTLAAGVNLPARRVIFRQPKIGRDFIDATRYRQMAGRAGRAGIDTKGESILICKPDEAKRMQGMMRQDCKALQSCLADDKNGMMRALLEVVAGGAVQSAADVQRYVRCTLLNATQPFEEVVKAAQDSLRWLCQQQLLEWDTNSRLYTTTPLGRAAFSSSLSPEESLVVFEDLAKAREGFVLASDLHLLYEVTPTYVDLEPDWGVFYQRFMELSPIDQAVGNRVGVMEPFLLRMAHGAPVMQHRGGGRPRGGKVSRGKNSPLVQKSRWNSPGGAQLSVDQMLRVCKRFYVALMLSKLVQEVSLMEVCELFRVPRGTVQGLQESAGRFAGMVAAFCERLGWSDMEGLVSKFQKRVSFGVKSEIVDLTEIPFVKAARARALFKAGFRSIQAVAEATLSELVKAIYGSTSWPGQGENSSRSQHWLQMGVARKIKNGARRIALDRAEEARAAALSAYEALGVQVPAGLALPLVTAIGDEEAQVLADTSPEPMEGLSIDGVATSTEAPVDILQTEIAGFHTVKGLIRNAANGKDSESGQKLSAGQGSYKDILKKEANTLQQKMETHPCSGRHNDLSSGGLPAASEVNIGRGKQEQSSNSNDSSTGLKPLTLKHSYSGSGLQPLAEHRPEPELLNVQNGGAVMGAFFTGSIVAQEETAVEDNVPAPVEAPTRGPVDVDKLLGGFDEFLTKWDGVDEFAFDLFYKTQNNGVLPELFEVEGLAVCWKNSCVYYVTFGTAHNSWQDSAPSNGSGHQSDGLSTTDIADPDTSMFEDPWIASKTRWRKVGGVLSKPGVRKIAWDLKSQVHALQSPGFYVRPVKQAVDRVYGVFDSKAREGQLKALPCLKVQEPIVDVRVAAWLLWPDEESSQTLSLEQEVKRRLPGEIAAAAGRAGRWANQMGSVAHNGCCRRTAQVWALHSALWKLLVAEGLHQPLLQLEMPLVKVLADMETWGLGVDMEACRKSQNLLHRKLRALEARAEELAGASFSLSVPAEVAHMLYRRLKLPVPPGCKGKQHPSTDKHALDFLRDQHPIADVIKEHRSLSKLLHSTLGAIIAWAKSPDSCAAVKQRTTREDVYCIFGHWLHTSTATGRLSMEDPNLQCVENPISFTIESESTSDVGQENVMQMVEVNARQVFVPTQDGWVLMSADYSQIEVRLMAHFSGDPSLVSLLSKPTGDLFRMLAAQWTGLPDSQVSEKQREHTKRLVYGILYGMGVNTLSEHLQCPLSEAQQMLERFKATFPAVSTWLVQAVDACRQKGYVKTLSGRKRYLDKINHVKWGEQAKAERQAVNSICQGSAADLIKLAMIKVHDSITTSATSNEPSRHQNNSSWCFQGSCRLLLQIHDELVLEVDKWVVKDVAHMLRSCMEGAATLRVPLRAKLQVGTSWGSLQPYTEDSIASSCV